MLTSTFLPRSLYNMEEQQKKQLQVLYLLLEGIVEQFGIYTCLLYNRELDGKINTTHITQ